jgi:hypothetical protein
MRSRYPAAPGAVVFLALAGPAAGSGDDREKLLGPIGGVLERPVEDPLPGPIDDPVLDPGPGTIDADTYFWASASEARGGVNMQVFLASRLRTGGLFLAGQVVGSIEFPLPLLFTRGEARIASIVVMAERLDPFSKAVTFRTWIDLDADGELDRPAEDLNVATSVRFATYLTSPSPHLIVEFTVPVEAPAPRGDPGIHGLIRELAIYPAAPSFVVGRLIDDGSRLVRVGSALTYAEAEGGLHRRFDPPVDRVAPAVVLHGDLGAIPLSSHGIARAAILSTAHLDAAVLNPFLFRWFDPADPGQDASPFSAEATDVDGDGLADLVLAFDVEHLVSSGALDETSEWAGFRSLEEPRAGATAPVRASAEQIFRRGDADNDGAVNLTDAVHALRWLFLGSGDPLCEDAADVNDDAELDITDPLALLGWLFLGGPEPPAPGPRTCGFDVGADALSECAPQECAGD